MHARVPEFQCISVTRPALSAMVTQALFVQFANAVIAVQRQQVSWVETKCVVLQQNLASFAILIMIPFQDYLAEVFKNPPLLLHVCCMLSACTLHALCKTIIIILVLALRPINSVGLRVKI